MLDHTMREAARLKMGVDMATGTGWPFGGPWVGDDTAPRSHRSQDLDARRRRASGRAGHAPPDAARPRHRQPDPRRQRRRARRSAAWRRGAAPVIRPEARAIQIADLVEPVSANRNLQALALEQVKYPRDLPLARADGLFGCRRRSGSDLARSGGRQPGLDCTVGPLDAVRALRRLARQARRARRPWRRRECDRSFLDRRDQEVPAAVRSRVHGTQPRRPSRVLQRLL